MIAAGVEATPGWAEPALARFAERDVAAVAHVVVDRDRPQRILSAGLQYTRGGSIRRIVDPLRGYPGRRLDRFAADQSECCVPELQSAFYRREARPK